MREFMRIVESTSPAEQWVNDAETLIQTYFLGKVVVILSTVDDTTAEIDDIMANDMQKGWGTKALTALCDLADRMGVTLVLGVANSGDDFFDTANDDYPSEDKLIEWYERFGFEINHSVWGDRVVMKRIPA